MKILLAGLVLLTAPAWAFAPIQEELFVLGNDPQLVRELAQHPDLSVDHVSTSGFEVYGPKGLARFLSDKGATFYDMKSMRKEVDDMGYPSFEDHTAKLKSLVAKYPHLASLSSIGKSVRGRDLWLLKISDNVTTDELEPEFKYISSMHGDEITGRELMIQFAEELLTKYGSDARLTNLVNNTEIFIMPSMNPDGSDLHQRANANGVDLNRHFPEATRNDPNSSAGKQPEVAAIMALTAQRNFALSANFHGGTRVVNYPWDAKYDPFPFESMVKQMSLEYARLNGPMYNSHEFNQGITNGADWYIVLGGMQDWSYVWYNELQVTIELSDVKWPNYSEIPAFYRDNHDSMIRFMELVHQGAGFSTTGLRNASGKVEILDNSGKSLGVYGFQNGEFYKVLPVGQYTFNVLTPGLNRSIPVTVEANRMSPNGNYTQL